MRRAHAARGDQFRRALPPNRSSTAKGVRTMRHASFLAAVSLGGLAAAAEPEFTDTFPIDDCFFVPDGGNDFFSLVPGRQTYFSNSQCVAESECDETEELWITVTRRTKKIPLEIDG